MVVKENLLGEILQQQQSQAVISACSISHSPCLLTLIGNNKIKCTGRLPSQSTPQGTQTHIMHVRCEWYQQQNTCVHECMETNFHSMADTDNSTKQFVLLTSDLSTGKVFNGDADSCNCLITKQGLMCSLTCIICLAAKEGLIWCKLILCHDI